MYHSKEILQKTGAEFVLLASKDPFSLRRLRTFIEEKFGELTYPLMDGILMRMGNKSVFAEDAKINHLRKLLLLTKYLGIDEGFRIFSEEVKFVYREVLAFMLEKYLSRKKEFLITQPILLTSPGVHVATRMMMFAQKNALRQGLSRRTNPEVQMIYQNWILLIKCIEFGLSFPFWEISNGEDDYWIERMHFISDHGIVRSLVDFIE